MIHTAKFVMLACVLIAQTAECDTTKRIIMPTNAQEYIAAFRRGEDFTRPSVGIIVGGQPDIAALQSLGRELTVGEPSVRENIVTLLVEAGLRTDPLTPKGTEVLRNPHIIALLAGPGLVKSDLGREAAMDALRKLVRPADLAPFKDAITEALYLSPTEEAFLLVAKAKPPQAKVLVDRLAQSTQWQKVEAAKIARAALGAKDIENEFLALATDAETAKNGQALAQALGPLALIGTPSSLKAIAERLRTPLTIHIPGVFEKSVRLNVLEALLYNFPDQPVLYPNNIITEANYAAAERFCTMTLGVIYTNPSPPFMTYDGYPIPLE